MPLRMGIETLVWRWEGGRRGESGFGFRPFGVGFHRISGVHQVFVSGTEHLA